MDSGKNVLQRGTTRFSAVEDDAARCSNCTVGQLCVAADANEQTLAELDTLLEVSDTFPAGQLVVRRGSPVTSLFAVRDGWFKSASVDENGREQVHGFFFPGELIGLDAIKRGVHRYDVYALGDASLCALDYQKLVSLSACSQGLQNQLFRLFASRIASSDVRAGDYTAEERLSAFLLDVSERIAERGGNGASFELLMSRSDIGSFLSLATETVSRVLTRMQRRGWISVSRKKVSIKAPESLEVAAAAILELG